MALQPCVIRTRSEIAATKIATTKFLKADVNDMSFKMFKCNREEGLFVIIED